jgi:FAD/FMN-containing dehydrogenase
VIGDQGPREFVNFGRDIRFRARHVYCPASEAEVLEVLDRHRGGRVRAVGSLHSWSRAPAETDVVLDLRRLDSVVVRPDPDGASAVVTVGAGCRLRDLLAHLHARSAFTVPTLGAITRQRIAGLVSTATHGSGRHSFSHYMDRVRIAAYDPATGRARATDYTAGPELLAARCGLGCLGVILEVSFRAVPKYAVSESIHRRATLDEVMSDEGEFPLQQFVLMPHLWAYYQYRRRVEPRGPGSPFGRVKTWLYRWYKWLAVDFGFHAAVRALVAATGLSGWEAPVRWFYRWAVPRTIVRGVRVTDESTHALTLRHDLFTHTEMEVFVPAAHIRAAAGLLRELIDLAAGVRTDLPAEAAAQLDGVGLRDAARGVAGAYTHHYPIVFRRVLPDDALIAMTADAAEPYYTVSLFTFRRPGRAWARFAAVVATAFARLFAARLHWGKYFPLDPPEYAHLYPRLGVFRNLCRSADPPGAFRNDFARRALGFDPPGHDPKGASP